MQKKKKSLKNKQTNPTNLLWMLRILFIIAYRDMKPGNLLTALNCLNNVIAHTCISIKLVCCSEATSLIFRCNLGRIDLLS